MEKASKGEGAQSMPNPRDDKLHFYPRLLFCGFFVAGIVALLNGETYPEILGSFRETNIPLILFSFGILIGSAFLVIMLRPQSFSERWQHLVANLSLLLPAICSVLLIATIFLSLHGEVFFTSSLLIAGLSTPLCLNTWILQFKAISYRNILFNSALVFLVYSVLVLIATRLLPDFVPLVSASYLLIASFSGLAIFKKPLTQASIPQPSDEQEKTPSAKHLLSSIPLSGALLYAVTTGTTYLSSDGGLIDPCVLGIFAVLLFLALTAMPFSKLPERRLSFLVYGAGLPAIAGVALVIKMIPIDFVTDILFLEFMNFYFQVLTLAAWTYMVSVLRNTHLSPALVCGTTLILISFCFLIGMSIGSFGYPLNRTVLGLITAFFLIFSIISLGRNIILYNKGPESEADLSGQPLNIEETCDIMGAKYKLSPREIEVLKELAYGHASSYVAKVLYISNNTARTHMKNIYKKLDINSREDLLELIRSAQKQGRDNSG